MKIGYFHTNFPTKKDVNSGELSLVGGGSGVAAYHLAHKMADLGHEVKVFTVAEDDAVADGNIDLYPYSSTFNIGDSSFSFSGAIRPLISDLDIIHAHVPSPTMDFSAVLASVITSTPLVVTCHSEIDAFGYGSFLRKGGMKLYGQAVHLFPRLADEVIVPSARFGQNSFVKPYLSKTSTIPNGINLVDYKKTQSKSEIRNKLGLPTDRPLILYLGALLQKKGPQVLINSFKMIKQELPDSHLVIAGSGPLDDELKELVNQMGLNGSVNFTGYVDESEKPLYFASADVFVLPSIRNHESFGIVNLEAMASQTPVVASRIGGVPDIVKDKQTGLLFEPGDPRSLAKSVVTIITDEELRSRLVQHSMDFVSEYDWDSIAAETVEVYRDL
ncbi:glycosyltransferase family 4 protein [Haloferax sp. YSMS24]|uniref:glycosyltransferase family 4 protein n=1 Tax=Haloferax sp. YSMS24 TaxID=3388425 RepID=UPI00398CD258